MRLCDLLVTCQWCTHPNRRGRPPGRRNPHEPVRPRGAPVIRRPPWLVAATAATCLVAGGTWATVAKATGHHRETGLAPAAGGSDRFLQLTGDQVADDPERGAAATRDAAATAAKVTRNCRTDAKTVGTTPTGWCIRPAGRNVDVL